MRRRYGQKRGSPRKEFVNSYHVNEVPLPYYNPLADPNLQGYFANNRITRHIHHMGLEYSPEKDYPYEERRLINFNKFHRSNYYDVPASHLFRGWTEGARRGELEIRGKSSSFVDLHENQSTRSQLMRRASDGEMLGRSGKKLKGDEGTSQQRTANSSRRGMFSSDGRRSYIFRRKASSRGEERRSGELIF